MKCTCTVLYNSVLYIYSISERRERGSPCWLLLLKLRQMGTKEVLLYCTHERGPSLVGSSGSLCQYKRFLFCLGCSSRPVQNIHFLTIHYFNSFVRNGQKAGQAVVPGPLSLNMCLWFILSFEIMKIKICASDCKCIHTCKLYSKVQWIQHKL